MTDPKDVSGVWYGSWDATSPDVTPNRFIAHLHERGGSVTGTVSEPDRVGITDILTSDVSGRRSGTAIDWTKQYDGSGRLAHAVHYSGRVDEAATRISGDWRFDGYTGSFAMERELFDADELDEENEIVLDL